MTNSPMSDDTVPEDVNAGKDTTELVRSVLAAVLSEQQLGEDSLDENDDFFLRGGNSLLVPIVASRLYEQLHRKIPLRVIVRHRSAAAIAGWLDAESTAPTTGPGRPMTLPSRL
ncbi:hypothetical protein Q0Z83_054160 [Actinoplanes sichuanensis]|uniref:Phosphopantetheine-binding protein n=1 Tax=Actinoplanes sichuanensis TaxID=512349 RepID=A0ABW4AS82_9ACTN|nr:phosphopantetheine-binding protein [Actinoplanes sichuanensis]BEL07225.1 hypothetical protein Q0Z83_054160 [Actinoplanes sichuanensis]